MSFILLLSDDKIEEVLPHLEKYEKLIASAEPLLDLDGRKLEDILKSIALHQHKFDKAFQEASKGTNG